VDFKTLFFVNLTALEDETTALYRDVWNQIPGDAASFPSRTDIIHTAARTSEFTCSGDCPLCEECVIYKRASN
jgi:hypothetical protein